MNTGRIFKAALSAICLAGVLALSATSANAASYTLNNINLSGPIGPFGTVNVSLVSGVATITFTASNGYLFGDGGSVAVNVNGSFSSPTILTDPEFKQFSSGNEDGWGPFNLAVDNKNFSNPQSLISFSITGTWSSDTDVLIANTQNAVVAAHVLVPNANGLTGYAAGGTSGGPSPQLPDGGTTIALLGFAVAGVGLLRRKLAV